MSEYPKYYVKGSDRKVSHNVRDDVRLEFAGYRVKEFVEPQAEQSTEVDDVTPTVESRPLAELVELPVAKDAEVVDLDTVKPTEAELKAIEAVKPAAPKFPRKDVESNTAPRGN